MEQPTKNQLAYRKYKSRPSTGTKVCACGKPKDIRANRCGDCQYVLDRTLRRPLDPEIYIIRGHRARRILLTRGQATFIWEEHYEKESRFNWSAQWHKKRKCFYAVRAYKENGRRFMVSLHGSVFGPVPEGKDVDHWSKDTLDNCWDNLREASRGENMFNSGKRSNNTSGYKWVTYLPKINRYLYQVKAHGEKWTGCRLTAKEAHEAACEIARQQHGEFFRPD